MSFPLYTAVESVGDVNVTTTDKQAQNELEAFITRVEKRLTETEGLYSNDSFDENIGEKHQKEKSSDRSTRLIVVPIIIALFVLFCFIWPQTLRPEFLSGMSNNGHTESNLDLAQANSLYMDVDEVLNFYKDPKKFVNVFAHCIRDKHCRIYYLHVGKTGGTTVEYRMFKVFPKMKKRSCCFKSMMKRFEKNKAKYCKAKFTSYQVNGAKGFQQIVSECMRINGNKARAIALITFREPIQVTLSHIHQACNKNFQRRSEEKQQACRNCSYDKDKKFWDRYVQKTNWIYEGIASATRMEMENVQKMTMDVPDINTFFNMLNSEEILPDNMKFDLSASKNSEKTYRCSFGMKSKMFKELRESEAIYRNLTLGIERV